MSALLGDIRSAASAGRALIAALAAGAVVLGALWLSGLAGAGAPAFGSLDRYAVIPSTVRAELTLVDMRDDKVAGSVALPVTPGQVLVSPAIERIVIASADARSVSLYDLGAQAVEATLPLPFAPGRIVLSPDGLSLAVAGPDAGMVAILRLHRPAVVGILAGLANPEAMTFSGNSEFLFVSDGVTQDIRVADVLTARPIDPVALSVAGEDPGAKLSALTRTPNGLYGAVTDALSGRMSVINFRNWQEVGTIPLGAAPSRPYVTADGRFMLVANTGDRTVSVISTEFFDVAATLPGVSDVTGISTGYFETLAAVVSAGERKVTLIDLESLEHAGDIALPGTPGPPVADADGRRIYIALGDTGQLVVIDAINRRVHRIIDGVGAMPGAVALARSNNYCH